jgi:uncharacterized protein (TIGR03067 family)
MQDTHHQPHWSLLMNRLLSPILAVVALAAAASTFAAELTDEQKKLQGSWRPTDARLGDIKIDEETLQKITFAYMDDRFTLTVGEETQQGTFAIDPKPSPKTLDLFYTSGPNNGSTTVAVYEVDGDNLTVCYSLNSNNRPTELKSEGDQTRLLVKFERKKES